MLQQMLPHLNFRKRMSLVLRENCPTFYKKHVMNPVVSQRKYS